MSALEICSEIIKLCRVMSGSGSTRTPSGFPGPQHSELTALPHHEGSGGFCERVHGVLCSPVTPCQCQSKAESTRIPFQVSKAEPGEVQVWQSPTLQAGLLSAAPATLEQKPECPGKSPDGSTLIAGTRRRQKGTLPVLEASFALISWPSFDMGIVCWLLRDRRK